MALEATMLNIPNKVIKDGGLDDSFDLVSVPAIIHTVRR